MSLTYEYKVKMSCGGCASSVKKAITRISGVQSVDTALETQTVVVVVDDGVALGAISEAIREVGKEVESEKVVDSSEHAVLGQKEEPPISAD